MAAHISQEALQKARAYFCPGGWWGGYGRWFTPAISSRVAERPMAALLLFLKKPTKPLLDELRGFFTRTHMKRVSHLKGVPPKDVECAPNAEGAIALSFLEGCLPDLSSGMHFPQFRDLCLAAKYVNIRYGDQDVLVQPSIIHSTNSEACFHKLTDDEGFDFMVLKSDLKKATLAKNGLKVRVLVTDWKAPAGSPKVKREDRTYGAVEATVYFYRLAAINPAKFLQK